MTLDNESEEVPSKKRRFSYANGVEKSEDEVRGEPLDSSVSFVYSFFAI